MVWFENRPTLYINLTTWKKTSEASTLFPVTNRQKHHGVLWE